MINFLNSFMMDMAQSTKCGSCRKRVQEGDAGAIGCDKCDGEFHGQRVGIIVDAVSTMGRVRGCFWLCGGCLEGDVFKSEAKFELVIEKQEVFIMML